MDKYIVWKYDRSPWLYSILMLSLVFYINVHFAKQGLMSVVMSNTHDAWFGMFMLLSDGIFVPFQFWVCGLAVIYTVYCRNVHPTILIRYNTKRQWLRSLCVSILIWVFVYVLVNMVVMFLLSTLEFGAITSFSWRGDAICEYTVIFMLIISFLTRWVTISFIGMLFIVLAIWFKNPLLSFIMMLVYTTLSTLVLICTPTYMSFKPYIFTSSINFGFFLSDNLISNIFISIGSPLICIIVLIILLPLVSGMVFSYE